LSAVGYAFSAHFVLVVAVVFAMLTLSTWPSAVKKPVSLALSSHLMITGLF